MSHPELVMPTVPERDRGATRQVFAVAAILGAMALVVVDASIVNVALPTIGSSLRETPAQTVLVVTVYQLALVMALLPCAALGESLGFRKVFVFGVLLFTAASAACALSTSLLWLLAARFIQGLGGAAVMSLGVALLRQIVPAARLGAAIGWNALTVALSSAAGPALGAFILSAMPWPWLFAVNLPLGIFVLFVTRFLPHVAGTRHKLDLISTVLNMIAFGTFVIGADLLAARATLGLLLLSIAAVSLSVVISRELPKKAPLIPLDLLRLPSFRVSVLASVCCFIGQSAGLIALPFYLEHRFQQTVLSTGLVIMVWPLTVALMAPLAGRLADHFSGAWLCLVGSVMLGLGLAMTAVLPPSANPQSLVPWIMLCGLGFALFNVPNNRNMFLAVSRDRSGAAGGLQASARLTGQVVGAVLVMVLFDLTFPDAAPRVALAVSAVLTVVAGALSLLRVRAASIAN